MSAANASEKSVSLRSNTSRQTADTDSTASADSVDHVQLQHLHSPRDDFKSMGGEIVVNKGSDVTYICPYQGPVRGSLTLSNYRLYFKSSDHGSTPLILDVPLCVISRIDKYGTQSTKGENSYGIELYCKDMRNIRFAYKQEKHSRKELMEKLSQYTFPITYKQSMFAYLFIDRYVEQGWEVYKHMEEFERMGVPNDCWRVTKINESYQLAETYPALLAVPKVSKDDDLKAVAKFRSRGRLPVLSWLNKSTMVSITRCSQPMVGVGSRRSRDDEEYIKQIFEANPQGHKLYIMDARPKVNASANMAKGGGYEYPEHYPNTELVFNDIHNIHVMRESQRKLKDICHPTLDDHHWLSNVESTQWLFHIKAIMAGALLIADKVESHKTSVMVHCSDGWDRTAQLTSLSMLLLDPYYRTIKGFEVLIEKEWLSFGHKFNHRIGHGEDKPTDSERSPVFLQFIDCVYQVCRQFPTAFEFHEKLLITILDHVYSCLYGTFLGNSEQWRVKENLKEKTASLWSFVNTRANDYKNPMYVDSLHHVLYPVVSLRRLHLWSGYYLRWNPKLCPQESIHIRNYELLLLRDKLRQQLEDLKLQAKKKSRLNVK